jgi:membrane-bound lytic murein transglycosylase B
MLKKLLCITCLLLLAGCESTPIKKAEPQAAAMAAFESPLDREIRSLLEKGVSMSERKSQVKAIEAAFTRCTNPKRARQLAALCFTKTLGTPFMPFDLAEIALAETGGQRLSAVVTSSKGALGVWQLMPQRARSHGYTPQDMGNDGKCAEAAVRELFTKLQTASGNLERAKKLYCGWGPEADAYMKRVRHVRQEMLAELGRRTERIAMEEPGIKTP